MPDFKNTPSDEFGRLLAVPQDDDVQGHGTPSPDEFGRLLNAPDEFGRLLAVPDEDDVEGHGTPSPEEFGRLLAHPEDGDLGQLRRM